MKAEIELAGGLKPMDGNVSGPATASIEETPYKAYKFLDISIAEGVVFLAFLFLIHLTTHYYSFLLFHTIVEFFTIFITLSISLITINCLPSIRNRYLIFIGISYIFAGFLELMHTITYKGLPIFTDYDYYAPQFSIAARYVESLSWLAGFGLLKTKSRVNPVFVATIYMIITVGLLAAILYYKTLVSHC